MSIIKYPKISGFTLIEALIAALVVGLGMLGLAKLQGEIFLSSADSRMKTHAQNAAQEKIEDFRSFAHQSTYADFSNDNDTFTPTGSNAQFNRSWTVTQCPNSVNCKEIQVTVTWTDSKNVAQTINLTSYIAEADPVKSGVVLAEMTPASPPAEPEPTEEEPTEPEPTEEEPTEPEPEPESEPESEPEPEYTEPVTSESPPTSSGGGQLIGNKSNCVASITLTGTGGTVSCTPGSSTYSCDLEYSSGSTEFQGVLKATISGSGCSNAVACVGNTLISGDSPGHSITITPTSSILPEIKAQNNNC